MKKIVYLPLDERPCNNTFCQFLAQNNNEINLVCPPLSILGLKKKPADYQKIAAFLTEQCADADYLILAVDMLLYGGLVPSRLHYMDVEEVSSRIEVIKTIKRNNPKLKIFAFSLVMRCPTYSSSMTQSLPEDAAKMSAITALWAKLLQNRIRGFIPNWHIWD